jgi:hypothetical protein
MESHETEVRESDSGTVPAKIDLLNRRGDVVGYALVDEQDLPALSQWTWRLTST